MKPLFHNWDDLDKQYTYKDSSGNIVFQVVAKSTLVADDLCAAKLGKHPSKTNNIGCSVKVLA